MMGMLIAIAVSTEYFWQPNLPAFCRSDTLPVLISVVTFYEWKVGC